MRIERKPLKQRLKSGEIVTGPWCVLPSPGLIDIIGKTGMDFVILDMEHGPHTVAIIDEMVRAAECNGCTPLVRVQKNCEEDILQALDLGAAGVFIPHIQSVNDVKKAIEYAKYFPLGSRGFSPYTRAGGYNLHNVKDHTRVQNDKTIVGLILEGKEGIENLDKILKIRGLKETIDIIYIGAYDLSQALGLPGQVDHPEVIARLKDGISKIKKAGIAAGGYVAKSKDDMHWMTDMGMQFITLLPDVTIIYHAFESRFLDFCAVKNNKEEL